MPEEHVLYHLEVSDQDIATLPLPKKGLRFFPNRHSMDATELHPTMFGVSTSPNLNMGTHRLDRLQLDLIVYASLNDGTDAGVSSLEVILEYE
jgi:hypothetical protein